MKKILIILAVLSAAIILHSQVTSIPASSGSGSSYYQTVQEEGSSLTQRNTLNFAGAGVTCADDTTKTTCTVATGTATFPFAPSRETASAANDRLRLNCDIAPYCSIRVNGVDAYTNTSDITATLSGTSATGSLYVYYTPSTQTIYCDENTTATLAVSGCTAATTGGIPAGSIPVGKATGTYAFTSNAFADPSTSAAFPAPGYSFSCGTNLSCTLNGTTGELSVDTGSTIPTKANIQSGAILRCASSTGSDTYTCTMTPTLTGLTDGMVVEFEATATANTGAASLNIDSIGATNIKLCDGSTDPANSDIAVGRQVRLTYDGTVFRLPCNPATVSGGSGATIYSGTYTTLTSPQSCTTGDMFLLEDSSTYTHARCTATNTWGKIYFDGKTVTLPPSAASFTEVTTGASGTSSENNTGGSLNILVGDNAHGVSNAYVKSLANATTFDITVGVRMSVADSSYPSFSFGLSDSATSTGSQQIWVAGSVRGSDPNTTIGVGVQNHGNWAYSSWALADKQAWGFSAPALYLRIQQAAGTRYYKLSNDRVNWSTYYSTTSTTHVTPTHFYFRLQGRGSATIFHCDDGGSSC